MADALYWIVPIAGLLAVLFAFYLARDVLSRDKGPQAMQDVGAMIYEGAVAFIRRQYSTIAILAVVAAVVIGVVIGLVENKDVADVPSLAGLNIGAMTGVAFLVGAGCSMALGHHRHDHQRAVQRPHRGRRPPQPRRGGPGRHARRRGVGLPRRRPLAARRVGHLHAVPGAVPRGRHPQAPFLIVGFGFGASFVALFAQLGGGIYTKAADVGVGPRRQGREAASPRTTRATRA